MSADFNDMDFSRSPRWYKSHPCSLLPSLSFQITFLSQNQCALLYYKYWKVKASVGMLSICHFSRYISPWKHPRWAALDKQFCQSDTCLIKTLVIIFSRNSSSNRTAGGDHRQHGMAEEACSQINHLLPHELADLGCFNVTVWRNPPNQMCVPHVTPVQCRLQRTGQSHDFNFKLLSEWEELHVYVWIHLCCNLLYLGQRIARTRN